MLWEWVFLAAASTPMPVVLGLDAVRGWPLFYSPLDDRMFVVEDVPTKEEPSVLDEYPMQRESVEVSLNEPENPSLQRYTVSEPCASQPEVITPRVLPPSKSLTAN